MKNHRFFFSAILLISLTMTSFVNQAVAGDFPESYPFSFWSEARSDGNKTVVTGRFEQGIEVAEYKGWSLIPFTAFSASYGSKEEEYWNNELAPELGIKMMHPLKLTSNGWGSGNVGIRQRWHEYFRDGVKDESMTEVFMQLGFGGDWK